VSQADATPKAAARRQVAWLFSLALALRLLVVAFAHERFPPADDGSFYHAVAIRIADGAGYTWAWPDGVVTHAAHYPVGYPALLGAAYALLGPKPLSAMLVNALVGALLVVGIHACALRSGSLRRARLAALVVTLHPTLILYTAAVMTEAVAASVLVLLASFALFLRDTARGWPWRLLLGVFGALLVLIRPQLLPMLPLFGAVAVTVPSEVSAFRAWSLRFSGGAQVLLVALACCAPWTLRNCARMDGCVFVSANGGWNLLIGTLPEGRGSFAPIAGASVPAACRNVFGEAAKDRCFGHAGAERIRSAPTAWLALAPQKLAQLFNHNAVASSYLQTSNPTFITDSARVAISAVETLCSRLLLLGASVGLLRAATGWLGRGFSLLAAAFTLSPWGYVAQLGLLGGLLAERPAPGRRPFVFLAASLLGMCVVTHIVFFGAPRYALIWSPWLAWLLVLPGKAAGRQEATWRSRLF
jgi:hypothetical protein